MSEINHSERRVPPRNIGRAVAGTVVHDNDFEVRIGQLFERREALVERIGSVVRADDHRHFGTRPQLRRRKRNAREDLRDRLQSRLRTTRGIDQPECPVADGVAAAPPFVGPGKRDRATGSRGKCRPKLHRGQRRLSIDALAHAVGAGFCHQQWFVAGDVLQTREIRAQVALPMQIHVERDHVDKRQVEILGRRVVDVGEQTVGRDRLGVVIELEQKSFDTLGAQPAHDAGGDFIAEREQQHRRMRRQRAHIRHDVAPDRAGHVPVVEERDMVRPRQAHHDAQAVLLGQIKDAPVRHRVGPDRVHAGATHQREVLSDAR